MHFIEYILYIDWKKIIEYSLEFIYKDNFDQKLCINMANKFKICYPLNYLVKVVQALE